MKKDHRKYDPLLGGKILTLNENDNDDDDVCVGEPSVCHFPVHLKEISVY